MVGREHQELSRYIRITFPETLIETYQRPWRERLFSWPWRPWKRWGERPTTSSLIKARMIATQQAIARTLEQPMYREL